eukprot:GILK01002620.1.p1 GENE.GILK01002620.1~~GILK01002620.1.p1  ORF type:complete len:210 (+),score=44.80 GILK01002620.1:42-632(+)
MSTSPKKAAPNRKISKTRDENFVGKAITAIPRNEKGGVLVTEAELKAAFEFFDESGSGKITLSDLKKRLSAFYKDLPVREYKFLLNNKPELTFEELYSLLKDNELTSYDPVKEAFKIYDPQETGFVDTDVLREIFENLGYGDLSDDDMQILLDTADQDKDGRISLDDFRLLVPFGHAGADDENDVTEHDAHNDTHS